MSQTPNVSENEFRGMMQSVIYYAGFTCPGCNSPSLDHHNKVGQTPEGEPLLCAHYWHSLGNQSQLPLAKSRMVMTIKHIEGVVCDWYNCSETDNVIHIRSASMDSGYEHWELS